MSRGPGSVQRRVLIYLRAEPRLSRRPDPVGTAAWMIAEEIFGHAQRRSPTRRDARATPAELKAVRRALLGLERRGLVARDPWHRAGRTCFWRAVGQDED